MASILKVDTIQGASSAGRIAMPTGTPIQMVNAENHTGVVLQGNASVKILDCAITTKITNSTFIVQSFCGIGTLASMSSNSDTDVALALGYKSGSVSSTSTDYTGIGNYQPNRHNVAFSNGNYAFYAIDALAGSASYNYVYHAFGEPSTCQQFSPSVAAGTTLQVALWGASDVNQISITFGTRRNDSGTDSGTVSYVCITEIAP